MRIFDEMFAQMKEEDAYALFVGFILGIVDNKQLPTSQAKMDYIYAATDAFKHHFPEAMKFNGENNE